MKSRTPELSVSVLVHASATQVFDGLTNWTAQSEWMLGTNVRATKLEGRMVGGELSAFTGLGRFGFIDTMIITVWDPPRRCTVRHTGRVVRGEGDFIVEPVSEQESRCTWVEHVIIPFGIVGRLAWPIVRPIVRFGLVLSLKRFAHWAEARGTPQG